jgi:hypothetical protein
MGRIGVGKRVNGMRGRFVLRGSPKRRRTPIYNLGEKVLLDGNFTKDLKADLLKGMKESENLSIKSITIAITTPPAPSIHEPVACGASFPHTWFGPAAADIDPLHNYYGNGEPSWITVARRAGSGCDDIFIDLRWIDWGGNSNRQEKRC